MSTGGDLSFTGARLHTVNHILLRSETSEVRATILVSNESTLELSIPPLQAGAYVASLQFEYGIGEEVSLSSEVVVMVLDPMTELSSNVTSVLSSGSPWVDAREEYRNTRLALCISSEKKSKEHHVFQRRRWPIKLTLAVLVRCSLHRPICDERQIRAFTRQKMSAVDSITQEPIVNQAEYRFLSCALAVLIICKCGKYTTTMVKFEEVHSRCISLTTCH